MIREIMSTMLCCFGPHGHKRWRKSKATTNKDSPLSMSVPGASVPHALDSPDALRNIFASNSSSRGYSAVQPATRHPFGKGSLDLDFQFGTGSPRKRRNGRLEQLTHHVRQTLSESRLGKNNHQEEDSTTAPIQLSTTRLHSEPYTPSQPLSQSEKSLGLTELLASGAASEGGYDSDARSMQTSTMMSATGTLHIGSKFVRKSLATIEGSQSEEPTAEATHITRPTPSVASSPAKSTSKSPCSLQIPRKTPLSEALRVGSNESPSDVLRRVSTGIADGTIAIPDTPELRAMRMPSIGTPDSEWRLSMSAPQRVSSLNDKDLISTREPEDADFSKSLMALVNRVELVKRESATSNEASNLMLELDPALFSYLEKVSSSYRQEHLDNNSITEGSPPVTAIKMSKKQHTDATGTPGAVGECVTKTSETARPGVGSAESSRTQSLHLFNMRISQRLGSSSRIPVLSSASQSKNASTGELTTNRPQDRSQVSSTGRSPTFIAIEHNRRPSDPATRKIFELAKSRNIPVKATGIVSQGSSQLSGVLVAKPTPNMDDSSSYYGSVQEDSMSGADVPCIPVRSGSLKNLNSLAIGGRSASGSMPQQPSMSQTKRPQDMKGSVLQATGLPKELRNPKKALVVFEGRPQGRSISMPKQSKFIKVDTTPTPVMRNLEQTTEANENMSEIDMDRVIRDGGMLAGSESTQAAEDRRNENFSDSDISNTNADVTNSKTNPVSRESSINQAGAPVWDSSSTNTLRKQRLDISLDSRGCRTTSDPSLNEDEAGELWHRAFKRLGEPNDHGKLLATPQFDREGRRKYSITSTSENERHPDLLSSTDGRARSVDLNRPKPLHVLQTDKHRRKSVPILTHVSSEHTNRKPAGKLKKSSLASLGQVAHNTTPPARSKKTKRGDDGLGIWARFASHTKDQRNGPAGSDDDVKVRDFSNEEHLNQQPSTPATRKSTSFYIRRPESWTLLTLTRPMLKRRNTRSMTFVASSAECAKRRRRGMVGRLRKLYRTKSSEFHSLALTHGHRGSTSVSMSAEYPELESLPGEGSFARSSVQHPNEMGSDGVEEASHDFSLNTISEVTSKQSKSIQSHTLPSTKRDAEEWAKLYQECAGSLSALSSDKDEDAHENNPSVAEERRVLSLSSALRDSTVNFQAELMKETDKARRRLLQQLQSSSEKEPDLAMPGSFV